MAECIKEYTVSRELLFALSACGAARWKESSHFGGGCAFIFPELPGTYAQLTPGLNHREHYVRIRVRNIYAMKAITQP